MEDDKFQKEFSENLERLNKKFERLTSLWWSLLRGIVSGVGTAIGATVVAAILLGALAGLFRSIESIPILGGFVESTNVESIIEEQR